MEFLSRVSKLSNQNDFIVWHEPVSLKKCVFTISYETMWFLNTCNLRYNQVMSDNTQKHIDLIPIEYSILHNKIINTNCLYKSW